MVTASARSLPAGDVLDRRRQVVEQHLHLSGDHVGERGRGAAVRHVGQLHPGHRHEQFAREVDRRAVAGRRQVDLVRIGLGVGDEFRDRFRRHVGVDLHHIGNARDAGDRRDIAYEIERQFLIQRGVDAISGIDEKEGIAIGRRVDHRLSCDVVAGAGLVLDDELLPELFGQILPDETRQDVGAAARGITDHPTHGSSRIIERRGVADSGPGQTGHPECKQANQIQAWLHSASLLRPARCGKRSATTRLHPRAWGEGTRHRWPRTRAPAATG